MKTKIDKKKKKEKKESKILMIGIRVDHEEMEQLKFKAEQDCRTLSNYVRMILFKK